MELKKAYQEKSDAQLKEWHAWIEHYKADPAEFPSIKPADRQRTASRLEDSYHIARVRLEELRGSKEEHWEVAKQAVERAMIDLKRVIDESGIGQAGKRLQLETNRSYVYEPFHRRRG